MSYVIVSNNSDIVSGKAGFDSRFAVRPVEGGVEAIYAVLEEMLQDGYTLITSPLPPNVPLIRSPVRSVIVKKAERRYDGQGLIVLEKARERTSVLGNIDCERTRADLEMIDLDQLRRAILQL